MRFAGCFARGLIGVVVFPVSSCLGCRSTVTGGARTTRESRRVVPRDSSERPPATRRPNRNFVILHRVFLEILAHRNSFTQTRRSCPSTLSRCTRKTAERFFIGCATSRPFFCFPISRIFDRVGPRDTSSPSRRTPRRFRALTMRTSARGGAAMRLAVFLGMLVLASAGKGVLQASDKTFDSDVLDSGKNAFVKFLAPW